MSIPIVSVDQLLVALEATLKDHLPEVMRALGWESYGDIKEWQQLPTTDALSTARTPAVAFSSPGLVTPPSLSRASSAYTATWRLAVGVYERGRDHGDTQAKVRNWCAGIRTTALAHKGLGGVAKTLTWVGEEYALRPHKEAARTLAAGAVAFDVTAQLAVHETGTAGPPVTSTPTVVTVR